MPRLTLLGAPTRIILVVLSAAVVSSETAQAQSKPVVLAGVGSFLTRDRGWNFDGNVAANVGVRRAIGAHVAGRALISARVGGLGQGSMPSYPPPPKSISKGVTVGAHLLSAPSVAGLYALVGADYFQPWGEDQAHGGTAAAVGGAGVALGESRQWALEGRYAAFARSRSATRGHLDVALLRTF